MTEKAIEKLAQIHKALEDRSQDNKKCKVIIHLEENGKLTAEIVESI